MYLHSYSSNYGIGNRSSYHIRKRDKYVRRWGIFIIIVRVEMIGGGGGGGGGG